MRVRIAHVFVALVVLAIAFLYAWGAELAKEREEASIYSVTQEA